MTAALVFFVVVFAVAAGIGIAGFARLRLRGKESTPVSGEGNAITNADLAAMIRGLIATLDDPAFALADGKQTNILLVPGDVQVEGGRTDFAVVLARGERAVQLEALVREHLLPGNDNVHA